MPQRAKEPHSKFYKRSTKHGEHWQGIVIYYDGKTGQRRQTAKTFANKREAEAWARKTEMQFRENPNYKPPSDQSVEAFFRHWLTIKKTMNIEAETYLGYCQRVDHIIRQLGAKSLKNLTTLDIQAFYAHLANDLGLSARTVNFTHTVLKMALNDAVDWGLLVTNPAAKAKARLGSRKKSLRIPTPEEMAQLIHANQDTRWYPLWVWFVTTGSRLGEALAVQWADVDWAGSRVTIRQAMAGDAGRRILKTPKTVAGIRTIQLGSRFIRILQGYQQTQQTWQQAAGENWTDSGCVFTSQTGTMLSKRNVERAFKQALARAELSEEIRIHDLRHGVASQWLASGINPLVVTKRLGHANVAFTLQTYGHVLPHEEGRVVGPMEDQILGHAP